MSIHDVLFDIQQRLAAPKGQTNSFGGYQYRSCEDVLKAVKPLLREHKVTLLMSNEVEEKCGKNYQKVTATLSDGTDHISTTASVREDESKKGMSSEQISGSASSYARKICLGGLFALDNEKDADATNTHGKDEDPVCEKCGKKIVSYESNGKTVTATRHCALSVQKFNKILCLDCINESKNS